MAAVRILLTFFGESHTFADDALNDPAPHCLDIQEQCRA